MKKNIIMFFFTLYIAFTAPALDILSGEKGKLNLDIELALNNEFNVTDLLDGFSIYSAKIGISGFFFNKLGFNISFDPSEIDNNGLSYESLKELFLFYQFRERFAFRIGHFIVPIGEELNLPLKIRPYVYHSNGSENLLPDYKLGIMFGFYRLGNIFGIDAGIFNIADINKMKVFSRHVGLDLRLYFENNPDNRFYFKTGYGCFLDTEIYIYQSGFIHFNVKTAENQVLFLFFELDAGLFMSYSLDLSLFFSASYRIKFIEPLVTFEWFDKNITNDRMDDSINLTAGFNFHVFRDIFFIRTLYKYNRRLMDDYNEHSIVTMFLIVL